MSAPTLSGLHHVTFPLSDLGQPPRRLRGTAPPATAARIGDSVQLASPDGVPLRIYTGSVNTDTARSADPLSEPGSRHPSVEYR